MSSPMEINGGSVMAMAGKESVCIVSDLRLGVQATGLATNFSKVFPINDHLYIGLPGFATDTFTLREQLRYRLAIYRLKEEREITPEAFTHLISSTLYEKRFGSYFVEPIIAGLKKPTTEGGQWMPYLASTDSIGCISTEIKPSFACAGTATDKLYGAAEGLWEPDMDAEQLFECASQGFLAAVGRDCLSGYGVMVHLITPDKVVTRHLRARMD